MLRTTAWSRNIVCAAAAVFLLLLGDLVTMARNEFGLGAGAMAIDIKLDGSNYREWTFSARTVLRTVGLASHLPDDPPNPSDDATRKSW